MGNPQSIIKQKDTRKNRTRGNKKPRQRRKTNESRPRAAKQSHLYDETLRKYQYVISKGKEKGKPELVEQMTKGWITINKAYANLQKEEKRQKVK